MSMPTVLAGLAVRGEFGFESGATTVTGFTVTVIDKLGDFSMHLV